MQVIVDSSVWISADRKNSLDHMKLKKLIANTQIDVCICKPISLEVCQGARTPEEFDFLWTGLTGFKNLDISDHIWRESALNFMRFRKKGLTSTTLDCLIATISIYYSASLWTNDAIFSKMSKIIQLDLWRP